MSETENTTDVRTTENDVLSQILDALEKQRDYLERLAIALETLVNIRQTQGNL
jgi:intein-encoded DNA endonuclease-like protein